MDAAVAELRIWGDVIGFLLPLIAIHAAWWWAIGTVSKWRSWDPGSVLGTWAVAFMVVACGGIAAGSMRVFGWAMAAIVFAAAWPLTVVYDFVGSWVRRKLKTTRSDPDAAERPGR